MAHMTYLRLWPHSFAHSKSSKAHVAWHPDAELILPSDTPKVQEQCQWVCRRGRGSRSMRVHKGRWVCMAGSVCRQMWWRRARSPGEFVDGGGGARMARRTRSSSMQHTGPEAGPGGPGGSRRVRDVLGRSGTVQDWGFSPI